MSKRIDEIRRRYEASTPGEWGWCLGSGNMIGTAVLSRGSNTLICDCQPDEWLDKDEKRKDHRPDLEFIYHAHQDIPYLLAEVERLQETNKIALIDNLTTVISY